MKAHCLVFGLLMTVSFVNCESEENVENIQDVSIEQNDPPSEVEPDKLATENVETIETTEETISEEFNETIAEKIPRQNIKRITCLPNKGSNITVIIYFEYPKLGHSLYIFDLEKFVC